MFGVVHLYNNKLRIGFEVWDPDAIFLEIEKVPNTCIVHRAHGLGAARRSQADQAEMVHGRQLGP